MGGFLENIEGMKNLSTGLQITGTAMEAAGSLQEGRSMAAYNRYIASQQERTSRALTARGAEAQLEVTAGATQATATQRAIMAANGITNPDIILDTQNKAELDRQVIARNANIEANTAMEEAKMSRYSAKNALARGRKGAINSLLSGASQVADSWARWRQTGYGKTPKTTNIDPSNPGSYDVDGYTTRP